MLKTKDMITYNITSNVGFSIFMLIPLASKSPSNKVWSQVNTFTCSGLCYKKDPQV